MSKISDTSWGWGVLGFHSHLQIYKSRREGKRPSWNSVAATSLSHLGGAAGAVGKEGERGQVYPTDAHKW